MRTIVFKFSKTDMLSGIKCCYCLELSADDGFLRFIKHQHIIHKTDTGLDIVNIAAGISAPGVVFEA
jgi:hypothetical protein